MATDYGTDFSTYAPNDLDETFTLQRGSRVVGEACARRLQTPRGALAFHPDYGLDLRRWLNESMDEEECFRLRQSIKAECEQDERVSDAAAIVEVESTTGNMTIRIRGTTSEDETFRLTLAVSEVTVELLEVT